MGAITRHLDRAPGALPGQNPQRALQNNHPHDDPVGSGPVVGPFAGPTLCLALAHRTVLARLKTTLQMQMLSCRTPKMVHNELEMHLIAYNLIRAFMGETALSCPVW